MAQYWHLLPSAGYKTGFIPRSDRPWSPEIGGWYQCFGARGVVTLKSIPGQGSQAASDGYDEIMSNEYNGIGGVGDWPGDAPAMVTHIYLDEPLSKNANYGGHWNASTLQDLAQKCSGAGRKLAIGESMGPGSGTPPDSGLYGYISDIIAATFPTLGSNLLMMPMHYYSSGWSPQGQGGNVGSINAWWDSIKAAFSNVKFAPWIAPTCAVQPVTSGCNVGWIKDSVSHAKDMGWNKVYFYLDDGFDSATGVRAALLDTAWAYCAGDDVPQNGCAYEIGVGV